ncbi:flavin-containing monooxygenase, partial [Mycolicibacterium insubricum]
MRAVANPKTAIIGAGISGLTSAKMLADYGVEHTAFEVSDRIGGNWAFGNPNGLSSAYRSLHIDTSKHRLSFKDFPVPEHFPDFPHHSDIKAYLDDYVDTFGLAENIEFNNPVRHARPDGDGWMITDGRGAQRHFDLLVVGNGHHWDARMPDFPGEFTGASMHSHHYVDPHEPLELTGKRILVVGIGNSAADITVELSSRALQNTVTLSTRSSAWIVPKYLGGQPGDKFFRTTPYLPLSWQRKAAQWFAPLVGA